MRRLSSEWRTTLASQLSKAGSVVRPIQTATPEMRYYVLLKPRPLPPYLGTNAFRRGRRVESTLQVSGDFPHSKEQKDNEAFLCVRAATTILCSAGDIQKNYFIDDPTSLYKRWGTHRRPHPYTRLMPSSKSDPPTAPAPTSTPPPDPQPPNGPSAAGGSSSSPKKRPTTLQTLFPHSNVIVLDGQSKIPTKRRDEHCFTYCYQTALSRSQENGPICTTVCWRKLFPHERPAHEQAQAKARAPGDVPWFDGRYLYYGRSTVRLSEKLKDMCTTGVAQPKPSKEVAPQIVTPQIMATLNDEQAVRLEELM